MGQATTLSTHTTVITIILMISSQSKWFYREGRAALVTSFGIFKYMACYGLVEFMSVSLLYWVNITNQDTAYLNRNVQKHTF